MTTTRVAGFASAVVLLVVAWALSAYVDGSSAWAWVVLGLGVGALLVVLLSSSTADRVVWRPVARALGSKLGPGLGGTGASTTLAVANRVLAELADCGSRLRRWQDEGPGWWSDPYSLPVVEWEQLRGELAGSGALGAAWPALSEAYREIDHVNRLSVRLLERDHERERFRFSVMPEEGGPTELRGDGLGDLGQARDAVERAVDDLRELVPLSRSWTGEPPR